MKSRKWSSLLEKQKNPAKIGKDDMCDSSNELIVRRKNDKNVQQALETITLSENDEHPSGSSGSSSKLDRSKK